MGSHQHTYIGPYLKINKVPKVSKTEVLYTCSDSKCKAYNAKASGNFCNTCGAKNANRSKTKEVNLSIYDMMFDFGDENIMTSLDGEYLIPNGKKHYAIRYDDSENFVEESINDKENSINNFLNDYKAFIDFLITMKVEYTVSFGVLAYYL
jgi:hypothetical protein